MVKHTWKLWALLDKSFSRTPPTRLCPQRFRTVKIWHRPMPKTEEIGAVVSA